MRIIIYINDENQKKPDSSIVAPEFELRTEGYKPSKKKKKKRKDS